jgi:DNA-binding IclR family transcriptional regulator
VADPTEFQARLMAVVMKGANNSMSLSELAARMKSNRVAVHSAVRSLERNGWAVVFRSDSSQWAVLMVAPSAAWRARGVGEVDRG